MADTRIVMPQRTNPAGMSKTPVVKPKDMRGTLRRLWTMTRNHRKGLGIILFLSALSSSGAIVSPLVIGWVVTAIDQKSPVKVNIMKQDIQMMSMVFVQMLLHLD